MVKKWALSGNALETACKAYGVLKDRSNDVGLVDAFGLVAFLQDTMHLKKMTASQAACLLRASGLISNEPKKEPMDGSRIIRICDMNRMSVTIEELQELLGLNQSDSTPSMSAEATAS